MFRKLKQSLRSSGEMRRLSREIQSLKLAQGRLLAQAVRSNPSQDIRDWQFQVFSQWGEDGIIQKLISLIPIANRTFIEFGVEDFVESNCRFLMMNDNWSGLVIDSSEENIARIRGAEWFWKYDLQAHRAWLTRDNINVALRTSGFDSDLGLLSIDIDGMDYWLLEAIDSHRPRILITEYNATFGPDRSITVPYADSFDRFERHHSGLYYGASLGALTHLAARKGYSLVGTEPAGVNAFFVRSDLVGDRIRPMTVQEAYAPARFRQSQGPDRKLTYLRGSAQLEAIRGLPVVNVESGLEEAV